MKLSIIVPVFNEEKTIETVLDRLYEIKIPKVDFHITIVNDGSKDKSSTLIKKKIKNKKNTTYIEHTINKGKGAAIHTGIKQTKGEFIVIQDADLEYHPSDLIKLLQPIILKKAKVVYGTRLKRLPNIKKEESSPRFLLHYFGNRFLSFVTSVLYFQWITDMETCYKIIPREFFNSKVLHGKGFNFEPEVTAKLLKSGYRIHEVAISTVPRGYKEGKKLQTFPEGLKALWTLIKYRFVD